MPLTQERYDCRLYFPALTDDDLLYVLYDSFGDTPGIRLLYVEPPWLLSQLSVLRGSGHASAAGYLSFHIVTEPIEAVQRASQPAVENSSRPFDLPEYYTLPYGMGGAVFRMQQADPDRGRAIVLLCSGQP